MEVQTVQTRIKTETASSQQKTKPPDGSKTLNILIHITEAKCIAKDISHWFKWDCRRSGLIWADFNVSSGNRWNIVCTLHLNLWVCEFQWSINWLERDGTERFYSHCDSDTLPLEIGLLKPAQIIHKQVWKLKWSLGGTVVISKEVATIKMKM